VSGDGRCYLEKGLGEQTGEIAIGIIIASGTMRSKMTRTRRNTVMVRVRVRMRDSNKKRMGTESRTRMRGCAGSEDCGEGAGLIRPQIE
jgi:hypothetical protein